MNPQHQATLDRLKRTPRLTIHECVTAIGELGYKLQEFAPRVPIRMSYFRRLIRGAAPFSSKLEIRFRAAFDILHQIPLPTRETHAELPETSPLPKRKQQPDRHQQAKRGADVPHVLVDYYEQVFRPLRLRGRSHRSYEQYLIFIRHFESFLGREATLDDLNDEAVTAGMCWGIDTRNWRPATANKFRNHAVAIWRFAGNKRHVEEFPEVDRVKEHRLMPTAWTLEQFTRLLDACYDIDPQKMVDGVPARLWWLCLLLVLYDSGIRIGAALSAKVEQVDLERRRLFVPAEHQKQLADQSFQLSEQTAGLLMIFLQTERELLFPWSRPIDRLYHELHLLLKKAGLPSTRRDKFHRIRRTSATFCEVYIGRGTAVAHLGHSSPKVTEKYIDPTFLPESQIADRLPRPSVILQAQDQRHVQRISHHKDGAA